MKVKNKERKQKEQKKEEGKAENYSLEASDPISAPTGTFIS